MKWNNQKGFAPYAVEALAFSATMDDVIKLVRTFRVTTGLAERLRLADAITRLVAPEIAGMVFGALVPQAAEEVLQDILISVAGSIKTFTQNTTGEFWSWCNTIAYRRIADHLRRKQRDRLQPMADEELLDLIDASEQAHPLTAAVKHDLDYALNLLAISKPDCRDYLWDHYITGLDYAEIAEQKSMDYGNVKMTIRRCLEKAQSLVA